LVYASEQSDLKDNNMNKENECRDSGNWGCALLLIAYMAMITILILTDHSNWAISLIIGPIFLAGAAGK